MNNLRLILLNFPSKKSVAGKNKTSIVGCFVCQKTRNSTKDYITSQYPNWYPHFDVNQAFEKHKKTSNQKLFGAIYASYEMHQSISAQ